MGSWPNMSNKEYPNTKEMLLEIWNFQKNISAYFKHIKMNKIKKREERGVEVNRSQENEMVYF